MSAEVQSLFGVRKVRAPPPGSDTLTPAVSASPSVSTGSGAVVDSPFGVRKTRFPPEGAAVATPDSSGGSSTTTNNSSPFGPRIGGASRGGAAGASAGGGGLPPLAETNSGSSSPFGATLRRTPSSVLGGSGAAGGSSAGLSAAAAKPMTTQQQQVTPSPPPPQQPTTVSTTDGRKVLLSHYERIEAFIYCLQAQRIRNQKRCLSAIHTIQQEYRAFLEREGPTTEIRNRKRTLRRQLLARLQAKFKDTALVAREEGLKIAMEEAAAWAAINRAAVYLRVRELALHEERRRQHVLSTELEAFKRTFLSPSNLDIPPCFIPGSLEREEWQMRIHILNFERFERLRCRARWIAEAGAILLVDEQNYRRSVMHMESADCMQLLHFMREDFVCARCLELSVLEARFRLLIEEQRHQFMRSLRRQCAGYLALTLMDPSNPYGEEAHRRAIEDKEHFYRSMFTQEFRERRYFLTVATCQRDEYSLRCGQRGIEAQERLERRVIHSAMLKGMLMRIQGIRCGDDDERMVLASSSSSSEMMMRAMSVTFGDPMTEAGGRSTIELQEARERRAIEFTLNKEAVQVFLPALEAHQRRTLVQRERRELQILIRELDILPLLFCTQEEPIARSRIVDASRQSLKQLMFHFAFLRLIGNELRERAHLIQQVAVFEERLLVLHYLSRMEITERRVLRKGIKSLNRRVREQLVLVPQQQQEQQHRSMMTHPRGVEALLNHSRFDEPLVLVVSDGSPGSPISKTASALLNRQQQQQQHQQRDTPLDLMTLDGSPFERRFSPSSPNAIFAGSSKRSVEALLSSSAMTHTLSVVDDDSASSSPQQSAFPLAAKIAAVVDQPLRRRRQQSASLEEQKRSSHTLDLLDSDEALDGSQWSDHLSRPPPPPPRRDVTDVDYKRTGTTRGSTTPSRNATELAPPAVAAAAAATSPISKQIDHRGGGANGDPSSPRLNPYLAPLLVSTPSLHQYVAPKATSPPLTTTPSSQTAAATKHASPSSSSPSSSRGAAARSSRVQVIHEYTTGVASSDHSPVMVIYRAEQIPGKSASK